jgi:hypothetical protein
MHETPHSRSSSWKSRSSFLLSLGWL